MKLVAAGTASAPGWPVQGCSCASCRAGQCAPRRPIRIVLDDVLELPLRAATLPGWRICPADGATQASAAVAIRSPDGASLLFCSAEVPAATDRGWDPFDTVVLQQGTASLDAVGAEVARLRRSSLLARGAAVVLVGVGHQNPPAPELAAVLAAWRVHLPAEGEELWVGTPPPSSTRPAGRTLVIGGTRSGKSAWAERQLLACPDVSYLATAEPREDAGWSGRIAAHRLRRPPHWRLEETTDLARLLEQCDPATALLIDDLGNWVARAIDADDGWQSGRDGYHAAAEELVLAWRGFRGRAVLVSPEVGAGVHPSSRAGRVFADEVGALTARLAAESDEVVSVSAGLARWLRAAPGTIVP